MPHNIEEFVNRIQAGQTVGFQDTMAIIADHYDYRPTRFANGLGEDCLVNEAGSNEGSCRIFYFAKLQNLSEPETLALFGEYYRDDVLAQPAGDSHKNIRTFMKYGWEGIRFEGVALEPKLAA